MTITVYLAVKPHAGAYELPRFAFPTEANAKAFCDMQKEVWYVVAVPVQRYIQPQLEAVSVLNAPEPYFDSPSPPGDHFPVDDEQPV